MAQTFTLPRQVVIDPLTLLPAPGAKAYFYITGTSTPQDVYSDDELTTPITQPVVADSSGVLQVIYLGSDEDYKLTLNRSDNSLLYTEDPIGNGTVLSTSIQYIRTEEEIAAAVTPSFTIYIPRPHIDIGRYGVDVGETAANNAAGLARAGLVIAEKGGGVLIFPQSGTVQTDTSFAFTDGMIFQGDGLLSTTLKYTGASDFITFPGTGGRNQIRDMNIQGTGKTGTGIKIGDTAHTGYHEFHNTNVESFNVGVRFAAALWTRFYGCRITGNKYGTDYNAGSGSVYSNAIEFFGCTIISNDRGGMVASYVPARNVCLRYIGGSIEQNGSDAPGTYPQIVLGALSQFKFETYVEYSAAGTKPVGFVLTSASDGRIIDTFFNGTSTAIQSGSGGCNAIEIAGCDFNGTVTKCIDAPSCVDIWAHHNEYDATNTIDGSRSKDMTGKPADSVSGTFTGTLNGGVTTNPTVSIDYTIVNGQVMLHIPTLQATSNSSEQPYISGMPAAIIPTTNRTIVGFATENGVNVVSRFIVQTDGVILIYNGVSTTFTNFGDKGCGANTLSYLQ